MINKDAEQVEQHQRSSPTLSWLSGLILLPIIYFLSTPWLYYGIGWFLPYPNPVWFEEGFDLYCYPMYLLAERSDVFWNIFEWYFNLIYDVFYA